MSEGSRIAVVGAGPAGLAAAYALQRGGARAVVFEERESVGGRTWTDALDGYRVDAGAQLLGSMFTDTLRLVAEAGLSERLVRTPGRDALWRGGRAHEVVYGSPTRMLASGALPFALKMRLGASYLPFLERHAAALNPHALERAALAGLDDESIGRWGERVVGRDFVEYLVQPQLAAFYGGTPEDTTEGLYHVLARTGLNVSVYALRGGAGGLCDALAGGVRAGGGEVRLGAGVRAVRVGDGVAVAGEGWEERFDGAVLATPAPAAAELLGGGEGPLAGWLAAVRYRPSLSLALLLDRPVGVRYFGLSFLRADTRAVSALGVQENKCDGLVPPGRGLLVAFPTPAAAPVLVEAGSRAVLDAMLPEISRVFPGVEERVVRARVYRWPAGNALFYPGYLAHLRRFRSGEPEGAHPVCLAGDYLHIPSVEGAVTSGLRAAERLLARLAGRD